MQSRSLILGLTTLALAGCVRPIDDDNGDSAATAGATATQGGAVVPVPQVPAADPAMRLEVDLAARKVYVVRNGEAGDTLPVAVGSQEWPTRTGEFRISQVVWNPEWIPPQEEWAKDEKPEQPGDPDNPLGQAQLVYDPPRSIHGTNEPASIGKAVSHGSIRMRNQDIVRLAREVMAAGGAQKDSSFFTQVRRNRSTKEVVDLPTPVPIVIR
jgi:lipoprotein-anchoring transpeptidase ErfK/SrfK